MKILITGGSGFIGTNAVKHFRKSADVVNLDCRAPRAPEDADVWKRMDVTDGDAVLAAVADFSPDYILHLAARTDLDGKTIADYAANVKGTENIIKAAKSLPGLKKIVITSSMLVCKPGYVPKHDRDFAPTTAYGESKIETERVTREANLACDWCLIRPSSIWGEYFGIPYRNFFDMVLARRYFHIGHRGCTKTYGYIGNAIYEIERLLFTPTPDAGNKVFYIGDYQPTNIEEWADEISMEAFGKKVVHMPLSLIWCAAKVGDLLRQFGIHFPMTSFRLHNMTTDNVVPLANTEAIAPDLPYGRLEAVKRTLAWLSA